MIQKARYFNKTKKIVLEVRNERRWHYIVGKYHVWIDEHGKFACDCTWGSLHINGLCSHIIAVLMHLRGDLDDKQT